MKWFYILLVLILCFGCLSGCAADQPDVPAQTVTMETETTETTTPEDHASIPEENTEPAVVEYVAVQHEDMKAMWLSQFDLEKIYLDGDTQRSEMDFTNRMTEVLDNIISQGFNTVFLGFLPGRSLGR